MKYILISIIKLYKKVPGPWHDYCRHIPTCSTYSLEAIERYGALKGSYLTVKRILKCGPWSKHVIDPVPIKE